METCIFCKISKGEIPCAKLYENESLLAFLDINPSAKGHTLIIPKNHFRWMQDADDITVAEAFKLAKKFMLAIKKSLGYDYVQVLVIGEQVPHFHIQLIPRHHTDKIPSYPTRELESGEAEEIIPKIIEAL
jgi:histidine triad (HIT) family protein